MRRRAGFTVAEVVIAMAIIIIVSAAMFTTISFALKVNQENKIKSFFTNECDNYISAYYLGEDKYTDAMSLLTGDDYTYGEDATIYYDQHFAISHDSSSPYHVLITFSASGCSFHSYQMERLIYECEA